MPDDNVELQERLKGVVTGIPRDEEQIAAEQGTITDAQRRANDIMKKMIEQREKELAGGQTVQPK